MYMYNNKVNDKYLVKYNKLDLKAYFDSSTIVAIKTIIDELKINVETNS